MQMERECRLGHGDSHWTPRKQTTDLAQARAFRQHIATQASGFTAAWIISGSTLEPRGWHLQVGGSQQGFSATWLDGPGSVTDPEPLRNPEMFLTRRSTSPEAVCKTFVSYFGSGFLLPGLTG